MLNKAIFLILMLFSTSLAMNFNPPNQVFAQHRKVIVTLEGCFVPVTVFQMRACLDHIAALVSDYSNRDDIIFVHNVKRHTVSSAMSLIDANIYIRNWPKLHEATIKIIYNKNVDGINILAILSNLFLPERMVRLQMN